jgi:hypothetical protein
MSHRMAHTCVKLKSSRGYTLQAGLAKRGSPSMTKLICSDHFAKIFLEQTPQPVSLKVIVLCSSTG